MKEKDLVLVLVVQFDKKGMMEGVCDGGGMRDGGCEGERDDGWW